MAFPQTDQDLEDLRFWSRYYLNNPDLPDDQLPTLDEYQNTWRKSNYQEHPDQTPAAPFLGWGGREPVDPVDIRAKNLEHGAFLDQQVPGLDLPQESGKWKGRYLGEGSYAIVGLWEHDGTGSNPPSLRRVVVKELRSEYSGIDMLTKEAQCMQALGPSQSDHIVKLVRQPVPENDVDMDGNGVIRRLIMEFCEQGELWELYVRRIEKKKPFAETTLWLLFNCLVDGISVLEFGNEVTWDAASSQAAVDRRSNWVSLVHFDLKEDNIFLGNRDANHPWTPVCKIGDFGLASRAPPPPNNLVDANTKTWRFRKRGAVDHFAPEQFTKRWAYADFEQSQVAGIYGPPTNVWGIGLIMCHLIMLTQREREEKHGRPPFIPASINGSPAKGRAYGKDLQSYTYCSQDLRDLVTECLYEIPAHRPTILELKTRIMSGLATAEQTLQGEPWADLEAPQPVVQNTPAQSPAQSPSPSPVQQLADPVQQPVQQPLAQQPQPVAAQPAPQAIVQQPQPAAATVPPPAAAPAAAPIPGARQGTCGARGGWSVPQNRPCRRRLRAGRCAMHQGQTAGAQGAVPAPRPGTCGANGGIAPSTRLPCKRPRGIVGGRCPNH